MANWIFSNKDKDKPKKLSIDWITGLNLNFLEFTYVETDSKTYYVGHLANSDAGTMRDDNVTYPCWVEFVANKVKYEKNKKQADGSYRTIELEPNRIELLWATKIPSLIEAGVYQGKLFIGDNLSDSVVESLMSGDTRFLPILADLKILTQYSDKIQELMDQDRNQSSNNGGFRQAKSLKSKLDELLVLFENKEFILRLKTESSDALFEALLRQLRW